MKDSDQQTLATALEPERLERMIRRDEEELHLEMLIDEIGLPSSSPSRKKERTELISKISRKYYEIANGMVEDLQYSEAIELYSKSITTLRKFSKKKAVDSYFNRAITLAMMGYPKMALDDLRMITKTKPPRADFYFVKGQVFESMGKDRLAERMYRRCLDIDPGFHRASNSLKNIKVKQS